MNTPHGSIDRRRSGTHPVWWVIAVSLVFIALNMTFRDGSTVEQALGQNVRWAGSRGIFAFTGPLTPSTHGVFMVDVDTANLWCYELVTVDGVKRLRLVASRSWIHDRHLEDYNVDGLSPSDVEAMVNEQRARVNAGSHLQSTGANP